MQFPLLQNILIFLSFSVVIVFLLQRLKLPSILGFLVTGIVIGPYGLALVAAEEQIAVISEIGIILLLFVIGMELSIKQLASIKKTVFIGGSIQVGLTILVTGSTYFLIGSSLAEAAFVGFLFSLSSTAIVLSIMQDRNEINTQHGKNILAILIFQDLIVVPMMLFTPIIAGQSTNVMESILMLVLKSAVVLIITFVSAKYLVPKVMFAIAKTRSKELFLLATITICFAVAFLTAKAGLSLALGAFLAGLIISESQYSYQATSIILPFRELFTSFFFISIGMMLDLDFFMQHIFYISIIVLAMLLVKIAIVTLSIRLLKYRLRTALMAGFALFQIGEFAFILSKVGVEYGLLSAETNQYFLAISIISMLLTPFVIMFADIIIDQVLETRIVKKLSRYKDETAETTHIEEGSLKNHLVIIGFGINGSNLARAAHQSKIPYVVIEFNAETVMREKENGIPIIFGDATKEHILQTVHLSAARSVVIAISDAKATKVIIGKIRFFSKSIFLLVRTRYIKETAELLALGADEVIPEEFETSVEIFTRVLNNFLIPEEDIHHLIDVIKADNYKLLQNEKKPPKTFKPAPDYPDFNITCIRVSKDGGKLLGESLFKMNLRANYGINVLAIRRNGTVMDHIDPSEVLHQNDLVFVNGKPENIEKFHRLLQ